MFLQSRMGSEEEYILELSNSSIYPWCWLSHIIHLSNYNLAIVIVRILFRYGGGWIDKSGYQNIFCEFIVIGQVEYQCCELLTMLCTIKFLHPL